MTKNEWLWVSIRVTGLVFLVMAVAAVPDAISGSYAVIQYGSLPSEVAGSAFENVIKAGKAMAVKSVCQVFLYTIFGTYLIKRGKFLHDILSKECNA